MANGTRLDGSSLPVAVTDDTPGSAPVASIVTRAACRFQPATWTGVFDPAGPPSGKMLVMNGNSPMAIR